VDTAVLVAVIGALASVAAAVYTARTMAGATRSKAEGDERAAIRQVEADAYKRARESYEGAMGRMQGEIDRQARQINALQKQVARLNRQVREAGLVPVTASEEDERA
jgi:SMC interacting uncharacterized protein involved in chromosome segregation